MEDYNEIMKEIEKACGKKLVFKTGYDYSDTINKFADGTFDIGIIGPAPYIKAPIATIKIIKSTMLPLFLLLNFLVT